MSKQVRKINIIIFLFIFSNLFIFAANPPENYKEIVFENIKNVVIGDTINSKTSYYTPNFTIENKLTDSILSFLKQDLFDTYKKNYRKKYTTDSLQIANCEPIKKAVLNVGWYDTDFEHISQISRGEMISIFILTKGYTIGDTVSVTIDAKDDEDLMLNCKNVTFVTVLENNSNMAIFQNIFCVVGKDEHLVINPIWENNCFCK